MTMMAGLLTCGRDRDWGVRARASGVFPAMGASDVPRHVGHMPDTGDLPGA